MERLWIMKSILSFQKIFRHQSHAKILCQGILYLYRLICNQEIRLGKGGSHELKEHSWFKGVDWENIRACIDF